MARSKTRKGGKGLLFFGMLAGAAIGAAVALIYSPSTGEENREKVVALVSSKFGS